MKHPSEEQLIEYYYHEAKDRAAIEAHFNSCAACWASFEALEQVLLAVDATPVPERDQSYGSRVWQKIEPRLDARPAPRWLFWLEPRRLVAVMALAGVIVAAFLMGRYWPRPQPPTPMAGPAPEQVRERILLVAVGDHLDRAQTLLLELVNAGGSTATAGEKSPGAVDISSEQRHARDLVASNRLYRQTAARTGDAALADVLDALEPILLEIAHSPDRLSPAQLEQVRHRIEAGGILFKVRVIDSQVRQKEKMEAQGPGQGKS